MGKLIYILAFILSTVFSTNAYSHVHAKDSLADYHQVGLHDADYTSSNINDTSIRYLLTDEEEIENDKIFALGYARRFSANRYALVCPIPILNQTKKNRFILFETDNSPPSYFN